MKKTSQNFYTDIVMFFQMTALAGTGLLMKYALPPSQGRRRGLGPLEFWGMDRHEWGDVHFWIAASLIAVLVLHLILHWRWIVCRVKELMPGKSGGDACEAEGAEGITSEQ